MQNISTTKWSNIHASYPKLWGQPVLMKFLEFYLLQEVLQFAKHQLFMMYKTLHNYRYFLAFHDDAIGCWILGCWNAGMLGCWDAEMLRYRDTEVVGCWAAVVTVTLAPPLLYAYTPTGVIVYHSFLCFSNEIIIVSGWRKTYTLHEYFRFNRI